MNFYLPIKKKEKIFFMGLLEKRPRRAFLYCAGRITLDMMVSLVSHLLLLIPLLIGGIWKAFVDWCRSLGGELERGSTTIADFKRRTWDRAKEAK